MKNLIHKFGDAGFLMISTVIVNLGNYAINLVLGRFLGPQEFAEANILATIVLMLSFTALGFQLTCAKFIATYKAEEKFDEMSNFLNWIRKNSLIFSIVIVSLLCVGLPFINSYLNMQRPTTLLILFVGFPLYIHMSISRGYFQGTSKFKNLAYTYLGEMLGRLVFTIILVYAVLRMDLIWASEAIALGFLASFIISYLIGRKAKSKYGSLNRELNIKPILQFFIIIGLYEFSQILINNSDVIVVKHFFENYEAGLYASLALIGRVVFFATWTIVTLLFPKVIEKEKRGEKHLHLFWISLSIVALIGSSIVLSCFFMDEFIVNLLFGEAYLSISPLLWKYAVATTLFSCANVFVYYHMSLNNYTPVIASLFAGIAQIIGLYLFHASIEQVILIQILIMAVLIVSLTFYHIWVNLDVPSTKSLSKNLNIKEYA